MIKSFDLALIKETMAHCVNEERALPLKRFINFLFFFWLYSFLILGFFLYHVFHIPFSSLGFFCTSSFHVPFVTLDFYGIIFSLNLCAWFFNVFFFLILSFLLEIIMVFPFHVTIFMSQFFAVTVQFTPLHWIRK